MSITLNFELNDQDLAHFHAAAQKVRIPDFIKERLLRLDDMIAMVRDEGWSLPAEDKQRVLSALMYFCDPEDVIPDHIEVLGFLDDAVMIQLSVRELKHELDAYDDFCDFRAHEAGRRGVDPSTLGRTDWLDGRR